MGVSLYQGDIIVRSLYLAEILIWLLLKPFFLDNGAALNQRLPAPKVEKNLTIAKSGNYTDLLQRFGKHLIYLAS